MQKSHSGFNGGEVLVIEGENKIEELLKSDGRYLSTTHGVSMLPMLKSGRDVIVVLPKTERLKPYDVALYRRGESYVLHRVIRVTDSGYIIRGDNTYADEIVPENAVIGVLSEYFSKKRAVKVTDKAYLRYSRRVVRLYPLRKLWVKTISALKSAIKKIIGKNKSK